MVGPLPRLLIVDDDPDNIRLLAEVLRGVGDLHFATGGTHALCVAVEKRPDLVLLDAEMPGMDGFQVCRALKADAATAEIPIIFVTAHSGIDHETRALDIGAVDFITKPISPPVVCARVRSHLTLKRQADTLRGIAESEANERRQAVTREAETALRLEAAREAVRALVNASPQPMAILARGSDDEHVIEWANWLFAEMVHRPSGNILGTALKTLLPDAVEAMRAAAAGTDRCAAELTIDAPDGPIEIEALFTSVSPMGTVMMVARDLTSVRRSARKEAERHRLEALGRMAGRIAHEINNVLQPVLTYASLAWHESQGNEKALTYLGEVQDGLREGREIVRSILSLAGGHAATRQPKMLEDEVGKAFTLLSAVVRPDIAVEVELLSTGGQVALAPAELLQILGNLVVNAMDAIDGAGSVRITTSSASLDGNTAAPFGVTPGAYAELTVADTGRGMDEAVLVRAFDPFFTTKGVNEGSGLGLATVRTLLDGMGGGIDITSRPGFGTAVRVVLPLLLQAC